MNLLLLVRAIKQVFFIVVFVYMNTGKIIWKRDRAFRITELVFVDISSVKCNIVKCSCVLHHLPCSLLYALQYMLWPFYLSFHPSVSHTYAMCHNGRTWKTCQSSAASFWFSCTEHHRKLCSRSIIPSTELWLQPLSIVFTCMLSCRINLRQSPEVLDCCKTCIFCKHQIFAI